MSDPDPARSAIRTAIGALRHPDADLLGALADAVLRRAPDDLLGQAPDVLAARLSEILRRLRERTPGSLHLALTRRQDAPLHGTVEAIWEDRPFLLSTIQAELARRDISVLNVLHPILGVSYVDGELEALTPARTARTRISVIQLEVADLPPPEPAAGAPGEEPTASDDRVGADLLQALRSCLLDVERVTGDHAAMRARVEAAVAALATGDPGDHEVAALLSWLLDDNLVLLGVTGGGPADGDDPGGLGLLRDPARSASLLAHTDDAPRCADLPRLRVSRTRLRSTVQRHAPIEVFEVQLPDGGAAGPARLSLLGLLTRKGIAEPVRTTPVLRRRLRGTLELEDVVDGSHDAVTLTELAHAIPKDELFRATQDQVRTMLVELLQAEQHRDVRVFTNPHPPSGTVCVVLALPRERWQPELQRRIRTHLLDRFEAATVEVDASIDLRRDAVVRLLLQLKAPDAPDCYSSAVPRAAAGLAADISELTQPWEQAVEAELLRRTDPGRARAVATTLARLPVGYRDVTDPDDAVHDLLLLHEALTGDAALLVALRSARQPDARAPIRLLVANRGATLELSSFVPILESLGLRIVDERPHELTGGHGPPATLHDFGVRARALDPAGDGPRVADAILAAWRGHLEVDPLNALVVVAGLDWRDVSILRAYRRLRRQLGSTYTPAYVDTILVAHPEEVRALVEHIHARLDPHRAPGAPDQDHTRATVLAALDRLDRLDHDRILRRLLELVDATLRTNAFRADAVADHTGEPYIALKFDPTAISDAPEPRPYREIFVHSPRVEGVHLRSGPVSRGGLRWSDRRDDVRSEVLDLVKAQVLKNAVIVPSGAKGGFVLKREPAEPAAAGEEARRQYVTFIRGLLDVTDNLDGDRVVPPPDVVRHDGDDPYLVVAADRGTATFSDTANAVSARVGFWLDDAFASGGAHGYDHKRYGVTARGAWVAVQRHFRELGMDIDHDPVTVAGIGDMSGDVFGNGLLRSRAVRLVAAFDHRHVFLDPDPDPATSFAERERLFALPSSSWADYRREVLSEGGMIVPRAAKRVRLSEPVRGLLRVEADELTPAELIQAVLRAPVDLLFAGGIGTYIRGSTEPDSELGDRTNAELRVEATTVRARVIGEGANLALTQRARIELARRGTLLNQDAIDNAAGVATSDLEVNLKILLRMAEERGQLTRERRNQLLEELAGEVIAQAVHVVWASVAAISREVDRSPRGLEAYDRLMVWLEERSGLDRAAEVLPDARELATRAEAGAGLTRPELATLMAWAKRELKEALLASDLPDHPLCRPALDRSLPPSAVTRFAPLLAEHRLHRELVTTVLTNELVDRLGVTAVSRLAEETGTALAIAAGTVEAAVHIADARRWWRELDALEGAHDPARIRELEQPVEDLVLTLARVLLSDPTAPEPLAAVPEHRETASRLLAGMHTLGTTAQRRARTAHSRWLIDDLVEPDLAHVLAGARDLTLVPDVVAVRRADPGVGDDLRVADVLLRLSEQLGIDRLEEALRRSDATSGWARQERLGMAMDLRRARRAAAETALAAAAALDQPVDGAGTVALFLEGRQAHLERTRATVQAALTADGGGLDALGVATRAVRETVERRIDRPRR